MPAKPPKKRQSTKTDGEFRSLTAESIHLVDGNGKHCGLIDASSGEPALVFFDSGGLQRLSFRVDAAGRTVVAMTNARGQSLLGFGASPDGHVGIEICNSDGTPALSIGYYFDQEAQIQIRNHRAEVVWESPLNSATGVTHESRPAIEQNKRLTAKNRKR